MNPKSNFVHSTVISIFHFMLLATDVECDSPSTFFWKPRLGLHLTMPEAPALKVKDEVDDSKRLKASMANIKSNRVILADDYRLSVTLLALAVGLEAYQRSQHYLQPTQPHFYTNAYRWGLRGFDAFVHTVGHNRPFVDSHKVWRYRFWEQDAWIPKPFHWLFPWITRAQWDKEMEQYRLYKKFAEHSFAKGFRYPPKEYETNKDKATISELSSELPNPISFEPWDPVIRAPKGWFGIFG